MNVEATTRAPQEAGADTIAIGLLEGEGIPHDLPDGSLGALVATGEARAGVGKLAVTHADGSRFILVGLGEREKLTGESVRVAAAKAALRARELGSETLCWELPHHVGDEIAAALVEGTALAAYRFDRYRQADPADARPGTLVISAHHDVSAPVRAAGLTVGAQNRARDLANAPANELNPTQLAAYAQELAERHPSLSFSQLDEEAIRAAGMGAFSAVAQGSAQGARLIALSYEGTSEGPRLGLIGKAVTFDSGGLSLKPAGKMHEMKFDMAGGAAVVEAIAAIAELALPVRALAVIGATENLPGGRAVKPGDVVTASDGTTIEINNTDAEGRLVLADCITYARRQGVDGIVDLATLTGAIVTALGSTYAGLFANDDAWAADVDEAGQRSGELVWRMPLHEDFARMVKGRYAQLTNLTERREASSITAAEFLHHFAGEVPWAHLDIAGTAYDVRRPYFAHGGATGYGVRLLVELARAWGQAPAT